MCEDTIKREYTPLLDAAKVRGDGAEYKRLLIEMQHKLLPFSEQKLFIGDYDEETGYIPQSMYVLRKGYWYPEIKIPGCGVYRLYHYPKSNREDALRLATKWIDDHRNVYGKIVWAGDRPYQPDREYHAVAIFLPPLLQSGHPWLWEVHRTENGKTCPVWVSDARFSSAQEALEELNPHLSQMVCDVLEKKLTS